MIWNITVDGEEALAVDTAEELGRALLTSRYVVASDVDMLMRINTDDHRP